MANWIKIAVALLPLLRKLAEFPVMPLPIWDDAGQSGPWLRKNMLAAADCSDEVAELLATVINSARQGGIMFECPDCDDGECKRQVVEMQDAGVVDALLDPDIIVKAVMLLIAIFSKLRG